MEDKKEIKPITVKYCGACSMPPEFCEFSKKVKKCRVWIKQYAPEYLDKLPAESGAEEKEKEEDKEKKSDEPEETKEEGKEGEKKEESKEDGKEEKKKKKGKKVKNTAQGEGDQITVTVQKRMGKKRITLIMGLLSYGLTLKDVSKKCSKKFACSTSVLENKFIEIQGDVATDVPEFLCKEYKDVISSDMFTVNLFEEAPKNPSPQIQKGRQLAKEQEEEEDDGIQNQK